MCFLELLLQLTMTHTGQSAMSQKRRQSFVIINVVSALSEQCLEQSVSQAKVLWGKICPMEVSKDTGSQATGFVWINLAFAVCDS